jgi:putative two-component system response regulator
MNSILLVDDNRADLERTASFLEDRYFVRKAKFGDAALDMCLHEHFDIILLNSGIPDMDCFDFIDVLRGNPALSLIPVILVMSARDELAEVKALKVGASDFLIKPIQREVLLYRISIHLRFSLCRDHAAQSVASIEKTLVERFAELVESRNENSEGHVIRISGYVNMLGHELLAKGYFDRELSEEGIDMMVRAAPLHDIGKIAISDRYLLKPDRLDDEEFAIMKKHAAIGAEILDNMHARMPTRTYLRYARMIAASHHERFDGKGYPYRLTEGDIPLCGRIAAVADVYDALVCDRVYRKHFSHAQAYRLILEGKGMQFDPRIVEAFESCHEQFVSLSALP